MNSIARQEVNIDFVFSSLTFLKYVNFALLIEKTEEGFMKNCIGIRQENKDLTERRAPLTPTHVKKLVDEHQLKVIVEPAENRVFPEQDYETAGATISSDLSESNLILGVKEIPLGKFLPQMAYCFFSHTIKGQDYNMPMLAKMLELNTTLLDYELVKDDKGRRTVFFGNFAGYAGMIDSLWALGRRLAWEGIDTPFKDVLPASQYHGLLAAEQAIGEIGKDIEKQGLPSRVTPFVTGFTGYGQVSKGAQHIFDLLPVERISPSELISFFEEGQFSAHKVYKVEFYEKDMFKPKDDRKSFDLPEYFKYPDRYQRNFDQYIPYLTMMINGI
ncbi:MAG: hypothetical protein GWN44_04580, partial [Calditrichae bacterium]|nr:hypothetical protein [Calditrichia bacterium]